MRTVMKYWSRLSADEKRKLQSERDRVVALTQELRANLRRHPKASESTTPDDSNVDESVEALAQLDELEVEEKFAVPNYTEPANAAHRTTSVISKELLDAVNELATDIGPHASKAVQDQTPRTITTAYKVGRFAVNKTRGSRR